MCLIKRSILCEVEDAGRLFDFTNRPKESSRVRGRAARPGDDHHGARSHARVFSCRLDDIPARGFDAHQRSSILYPLDHTYLCAGFHVHRRSRGVFLVEAEPHEAGTLTLSLDTRLMVDVP